MQISVIGHPLEIPLQALEGTHDQGGWLISLLDGYRSEAWSHGIELRFDTELGDE